MVPLVPAGSKQLRLFTLLLATICLMPMIQGRDFTSSILSSSQSKNTHQGKLNFYLNSTLGKGAVIKRLLAALLSPTNFFQTAGTTAALPQTCPACPTCYSSNNPIPAPIQPCPGCQCPAVTSPATISITINANTDCRFFSSSKLTNNDFASCTQVTTLPAGSFSVNFVSLGLTSGAVGSTALIGITASCPNTKITLTCDSIPVKYIVQTQTANAIANGLQSNAVPEGIPVTEKVFMLVKVTQVPKPITDPTKRAQPAIIKCQWLAS